jgi:hypothetical protein
MRSVVSEPADVPSPCTQVCVLDPRKNECTGCGRTLEEITAWARCTVDEKRRIVERAARRRRERERG